MNKSSESSLKKVLTPVIITILVLLTLAQTGALQAFGINKLSIKTEKKSTEKTVINQIDADSVESQTDGTVNYRFKAEGDYFYVYQNGMWNQEFMKGVNVGSGKPGSFPGDLNLTYDDYYRWFEEIAKMNANCIRIYTAMLPDFYNALFDFNSKHTEEPLYLFQGVWMDEDDIATLNDVYADNNKIYNQFKKDALDLVNIIHGKCTLSSRTGYASGTYISDVSPWLQGWIIGMEFDPSFIENVNSLNYSKDSFDGTYLYTQGSTPFEAFLADIGNSIITEESEKYAWQTPIAFCNWVTTDPLIHPEEQDEDEDWITLNTESIKTKTAYNTGEFASYHVYPYYPDTMSYQKDYIKYKDETGKINTFEAYLKDLKTAHTMPIVIAEFGVSTSRGKAHESLMGWNQGEMEETSAGNAIVDMFKSIYNQGYAGGIVFSWQDEWFKRTWNNEDFDDSERRPFWANYQTCEQFFGLLAFDPGEEKTACVVDGDVSEWSENDVVAKNGTYTLSMKSDEGYVYFMVDAGNNFDFAKQELLIPIDTIQNQGNTKMNGTKTTFDTGADFVIDINGEKNSRILCDAYYDVFSYFYGYQGRNFAVSDSFAKKNSGIFNKMNMCTGFKITIPSTKQKIPFAYYETGLLHYGNADPDSKEYDSLSDFCQKDGKLEIRIPWQLLNFTDPSKGKIMSDFYEKQSVTSTDFSGFKVGIGNKNTNIKLSGEYTYIYWKDNPKYHERLKKSYYILKKELPKIGV